MLYILYINTILPCKYTFKYLLNRVFTTTYLHFCNYLKDVMVIRYPIKFHLWKFKYKCNKNIAVLFTFLFHLKPLSFNLYYLNFLKFWSSLGGIIIIPSQSRLWQFCHCWRSFTHYQTDISKTPPIATTVNYARLFPAFFVYVSKQSVLCVNCVLVFHFLKKHHEKVRQEFTTSVFTVINA